jgi:hypothetical protein
MLGSGVGLDSITLTEDLIDWLQATINEQLLKFLKFAYRRTELTEKPLYRHSTITKTDKPKDLIIDDKIMIDEDKILHQKYCSPYCL